MPNKSTFRLSGRAPYRHIRLLAGATFAATTMATIGVLGITPAQAGTTSTASTTAAPAFHRLTAAAAAAAGRYTGQTVTIPLPVKTFTVNTTNDLGDTLPNGVCRTSAGDCSLRAALAEANRLNGHAGVAFNIPVIGIQTINVATKLPTLTNPQGITIDGYTQPGSLPNTNPLVSNATIVIAIKGPSWTGAPGFQFASTSTKVAAFNKVTGLSMYRFSREVWMIGGSHDNLVVGNYLCTDPLGTVKSPAQYTGSSGVNIQDGAHDVVVGTPALADRNVLSGCPHHGIATYDFPTRRITIQNNIVGLNPAGTARLANKSHGVDINTDTTDTITGGYNPGEGNLVSGNNQAGIEVSHNAPTLRNDIVGNLVGTNPAGTAAPPQLQNDEFGVRLEGRPKCPGPTTCPDAGDSLVANNTIVNSGLGGVQIDKGRHDDVVQGNRIGLLADGTPAGNANYGIRIEANSQREKVTGNEIAYNDNGIQLQSVASQPLSTNPLPTNFNTISRNSSHDNGGRGIDLAPLNADNTAANADPKTNEGILAPSLSATQLAVTATTNPACSGCTVELFYADVQTNAFGEGETYLDSATTDSSGTAVFAIDPDAAAGKYVTATVTNPNGSTSEFSRNVLVPPVGSTPPVAFFTYNCHGSRSCDFDGSGSTDPGGSIARYQWDFGDGATGTGATVTHPYAADGTYTVKLTVTDNQGAKGSTTQEVVVLQAANQPPTAAAGTPDCTAYACSFDGSNSTDPNGNTTIASYAWDFGDGTTDSGRTVNHTYAVAGSYPVTLTVTDDQGETDSDSTTATPSPPTRDPVLGTDSFTRSGTGGFGTADQGGAWSILGNAANFGVNGNAGTITLPAGVSNGAILGSVDTTDADVTATVSTSATPQAFGQAFSLLPRRVSANHEYRLRVHFSGNTNNPIYLSVSKLDGSSTEVLIGTEVRATGLNWSPGTRYQARVQIADTSPTMIRGRVWPAGQPEPTTWLISKADGSASLQSAGAVGVRGYVASATTTGPVTFTVDDFSARNEAPVATFSPNCSGLTCSPDAAGSSDPENGNLAYAWNFGDGFTDTTGGQTSNHAYAQPGTYTITLTATDPQGVATAVNRVVTVS